MMTAKRGLHFDPDILDRFLAIAGDLYAAFKANDERTVQTALPSEIKRYFA